MNYQCYYEYPDGTRCKKEQAECWCSDEHREKWQAEHYKNHKSLQKRSTEEMQEKIKEMGKHAKF